MLLLDSRRDASFRGLQPPSYAQRSRQPCLRAWSIEGVSALPKQSMCSMSVVYHLAWD